MTIDIGDIRVVRIMKKSKALLGAGIGLSICAGIPIALAFGTQDMYPEVLIIAAVVIGVPAILIGTILGEIAGTDKTIQIEGKSPHQIELALERLSSKARVKNAL